MGEEKPKQVQSETSPPAPAEEKTAGHYQSYEKALVPIPEEKASPSKPSLLAEKTADHKDEKSKGNSEDRDSALARVEVEKRLALVKAWEENEKTKADNKACKKLSTIGAWENTKRASLETELKQIEENFEKKKAEYAEKMKNKMAEIHRAAEEKKAAVEAKRGEEIIQAEEMAAKFRATGNIPKRLFGCFSC